jgi:PST family polysaccharide transporter
MHIRKELAKGTFWTAVGSYSRYLFSFIVSAILARLLTANDFGVVSMVMVYTGFVDLLAEFGISATVVQKRYLDRRGLSTVFWLAAFIGVTLTGISILLAPVIESFFDFAGLRVVVQVMSVNLLLVSLATVPQGLMQQKLGFKQLAILEIISTILSGIVGITLAFQGWGYWALVIQGISTKAFTLIGYFIFTRWLPLFALQMDTIRDIVSFSGNLLGFRMINYWSRNADNLIIGRTLGSTQLGFYNQAYTLMMYPIRILTSVINPSIQPVFATAQDEPQKIAPTYLLLLEMIALITFPMGIFLRIFAGPVILVLWGNQWEASIPVFEVLAFLTMVQPILATSGSVFIARNKARLLFRLGTLTSVIIIAGIAIGSLFGIVGVATGYAIAYLLLATPLTLTFLAKAIEVKLDRMLAIFIKPAIISVILAPTLLVFKSFNFPWSNLGIVAGAGVIFLIIWGGVSFILYRKQLKSILEVLRLRFNAKI